MLQLTTNTGRVIQRVFLGAVADGKDADAFLKELQEELKDNHTGQPLMVEIWRDATPKPKKVR